MPKEEKTKNESSGVTYGGGNSRKIYEGKKDPSKTPKFYTWVAAATAGIVILFALAGVFAVFSGSLISSGGDSGNKYVVKVPSVSELSSELTPSQMTAMMRKYATAAKITYKDGTEKTQAGFFITSDGIAVTSASGFDGREIAEISLYCGDFGLNKATFLGADAGSGCAFVKLPYETAILLSLSDAPLGNSANAKVSDDIWCIPPASAGVYKGFVRHGYISSVSVSVSGIDTAGEQQNSFNPVFADFEFPLSLDGAMMTDSSGKIIGMCRCTPDISEEGLGFAVPSERILASLKEIND